MIPPPIVGTADQDEDDAPQTLERLVRVNGISIALPIDADIARGVVVCFGRPNVQWVNGDQSPIALDTGGHARYFVVRGHVTIDLVHQAPRMVQ